MKLLKFIFLISIILILAVKPCLSWTITKELEKELAQKRASVEANPNDPHAHFDLAITYAYTNYIQEGWDELKKTHELNKEFAPIALAMYEKKVAQNPNDWKLRFRLAFALYFNEKKSLAINELFKIINMEPKDDPKRVWAYGYIGLIYGELDDIDKAIKYVKKALKIDSNVAALHVLLASGYYKKGQSWDAFWEGVEGLRLKALGY